jgi:TRAP-type C4-dicarboxylate transport system permease small subunit
MPGGKALPAGIRLYADRFSPAHRRRTAAAAREQRGEPAMKRILRVLDEKFEEVIGVVLLGTLITLIFINVILRVFFTSGFSGQEELSRIFYVLVVYIGASYGIRSNDHIRVNVIVEILPPKAQKVLGILTDIIWAGFNIAIIIISMDLYERMQSFSGKSAMFDIPLHYIFLTIPAGFALLTFRLVQSYFRPDWKEGQTRELRDSEEGVEQ